MCGAIQYQDAALRRRTIAMRYGCIVKGRTNLSPMDVALSSEKAFVACTSFCEGCRDEIRFGEVISVTKNVGKSKRVGGDETIAIDETAVGKGVSVDFGPFLEYVAIFFARYLCKVSNEERWGWRRWQETKRRAETRDDEFREWPENVEDYSPGKEQEDEAQGGHGTGRPSRRGSA